MKELKVLQLKKDAPDRHHKIFESYEYLEERYGEIDMDDYEVVYEGKVPNEMTDEGVYMMCNLDHPAGYKGHSLSVSDIIIMDGKVKYCDSIGFREVEV